MSGADDKGPIPGAVFPGGDTGRPFGGGRIPKKSSDNAQKATSAGTSSSAGDGEGDWSDVRAKKGKSTNARQAKAAGSQPNAKVTGGQPTRSGAVSFRSSASPSLIARWSKEKRCLECGSDAHFIRDCPKRSQPGTSGTAHRSGSQPTKSGGASGSQPASSRSKTSNKPQGGQPRGKVPTGAQSTDARGEKRKRDPAPTGVTPPPKKPVPKKFSYAAMAAGAIEVAIVTRERAHISKKHFNAIRDAVEEKWFSQLDEGKEPFAVEGWSYTSQYATFSVPNDVSAGQVEGVVRDQGFLAIPKATLLEERKPTTILTGLVTGSAAKRDRSQLERLLKFEANRLKIDGRIEFYSSSAIQKSGNTLLRILVDEDAKQQMSRVDFELRIGASGKVKFIDERAQKKSNPEYVKRRLTELEQSIDEHKQRIRAELEERRQLQEDLEKPPASVGSVGLSSLNVDDVEETDETAGDKEAKEQDELLMDDQ